MLEELIHFCDRHGAERNQPSDIDGRFELALPVLLPLFLDLLNQLVVADFAHSLQLLTTLNRDE